MSEASPTASVPPPHSWRVGHEGKDDLYYEEWIDGGWKRLLVSGELSLGPTHHLVFVDSESSWQQYKPAWARDRRAEIIARIKRSCPEPRYEYIDLP